MCPPADPNPHAQDYNVYLRAAREVVEYIRGLGIAASNRPADVARYGNNTVAGRFQQLDGDLMEVLNLEGAALVKAISAAVQRSRAGNCEDQANLAFDLLARRGIRPLELIALVNSHGANYSAQVTGAISGKVETYQGPDHVFVLLNRQAGNLRDPNTWNPLAVVCDPWAKRAYYACDLADEMALLSRVSGDWTETSCRSELRNGAW